MSHSTQNPNFSSPASAAQTHFATTHWSVVLAARDSDSPEAAAALERLCQTYWRPLYVFIRREGYDATEAQDLTQDFFLRLVSRNFLQHLRHQEGRFRSFLLTFLKHFLLDYREKAGAQKRGGGQTFVSLEQIIEEDASLDPPADKLSPDQVFERRWAETVMQQALARLRMQYHSTGRGALFDSLSDFHPREPGGSSYAEIGASLGISEAAVKSAAQRLRQRHREIVREEIAHTVIRPDEIDDEIRHLREVLSS